MTRISIAMATYNGGKYLREQLDSFAAQTRLPDELIITDDGSSDDTVDIAHAFAGEAPFEVSVVRNPQRLGYSDNFARALRKCGGDVMFMSDQDDRWDSQKIAVVLARFDGLGPAVVSNNATIVDESGEPSGLSALGALRRAGMPDTEMIAGACTAFSRPLLDLLLPFPREIPYDCWIGAVADALAIKRLIERPLQTYRRHRSNTSDPLAIADPAPYAAFRHYGLSDPRDGWRTEIVWREELSRRLTDPRLTADLGLCSEHIDRANAKQRTITAALGKRVALLERPRRSRWISALSAWHSGLYREFHGAMSLAKDLIRP